MVITFDKPTNGYTVTPGNVDTALAVEGKSWGAISSASWSTVGGANDTLTIVFGDAEATVAVGDVPQIDTDAAITNYVNSDAAGNPSGVAITGTFGVATVGHLLSAAANWNGNALAGVQDGDQVVLTFDSPTNAYAISAENINSTLILLGSHNWGQISGAVWSTSAMHADTLTVTLAGTGSPTVAVGDGIVIGYGTIKDLLETNTVVSEASISGSFGPKPSLLRAVMEDSSGEGAGIQIFRGHLTDL